MQQKSTVKKKTEPLNPNKTSPGSGVLFLLAGAIAIITFFSFSPALKNGFTNWDDNAYVFENMHLSKPLPEAVQYFFEPHYFIGNYIPVTMIAYTLEFQQAGLQPELYHAVNILIHLLNVLLVFWFIYLLSGKKPVVAAIVSLFFGIHPMHVESVAWVAELKDVLYSFFFIAGLIAYYKYTEARNEKPGPKAGSNLKTEEQSQSARGNYLQPLILAFVLFIFSALSKPAAVIFPLVLLLLDFYTGRKFDKWVWIEKIPFFIVSFIFGIVAIKAQQADRLIHDYYPFSQRLFFACHSFLDYLVKLFLPINLSIFYPYPPLTGGHLPVFYYVTPAFVILLFYSVYRTLKYSRLITFGVLFFLANIILVLQLLAIGDAAMADRYTYIPYIGLFFIIAMGFDWLYHSTKPKLSSYKSVAVTAIILLAITCSYLTYARCEVWENDDTIATDLLEKFPDDRLALNNKGFILFVQRRYEESIPLFTKAIKIRPNYVMAYINLVNSYLALKDIDDALKITDTALVYAPHDYSMLNTKGFLLLRQHKYSEAIAFYQEAIRLKQDNMDGYINLAQCYYLLQDNTDWIKTLDIGLTHDADNYILLNNKGYSLFLNGKYSDALEYYKASLKIKPDYTTATVNLSNCYRAIEDSVRVK